MGIFRKTLIGLSLLHLCYATNIAVDQHPRWFIAVRKNSSNTLLEDTLSKLNDYTPLLPPQNKFYADPMLFKYQGTNYIFFEDYDHKKNKGIISYISVDKNLNFSTPKTALELSTHLAFPHIFEDNGTIYMTPETYALKKVILYEATDFPNNWKQKQTLLSGEKFSDPVIFKHQNYYYLFVAVNRYYLRIFYADNLFGPFKPHPINKQENYNLRNAGRVFYANDKLIRPVMDCSKIYGGAIRLHEIIDLSPTTFTEKKLYRIEPTWAKDLTRTHTFNQNEDLVVYDGGYGMWALWRFIRLVV